MTGNMKGVADSLAYVHQNTVAIPPAYGSAKEVPAPVKNLRIAKKEGKIYLEWDADKPKNLATDQIRFVVYSFLEDEDIDLDNVEAIMIMTPRKEYMVSEDEDESAVKGMRFAVTALDRNNRESVPLEITL